MTKDKGEENLDDLPELDPVQDAVGELATPAQEPSAPCPKFLPTETRATLGAAADAAAGVGGRSPHNKRLVSGVLGEARRAKVPKGLWTPDTSDENLEDLPELEILGEVEPAETPEAGQREAQEIENLPELEVVGEVLEQDSEVRAESVPLEDSEAGTGAPEEAQPEASSPQETANWRQTYELDFRGLPRDVRIDRAHTATGDTLCALCFDPQGGVIEAVLQNSEVGLKHARLIADHHRDPFGLEALGRRAEFLRDSAVRRLLLRNLQATDSLLKKMLSPLSLQHTFRLTLGHESSERGRRVSREVFRAKFVQGSAEERVGLIVRSEGRCLSLLAGLTLDQKTTALLCARTYQSTLLVQNLGRFSATPPNLIGALLKQPLVQRSQQLKRLLLQHKNCPSALKK